MKYLPQTFLAFACLCTVFTLGGLLSGSIVGPLGATAFIIFSLPKSKASGPGHIIGGYLRGAAAVADHDSAVLLTVSAMAGVLLMCSVKHCFRGRLNDLFH